jgi:ABC-type glycerol-3-phosphate transport system permease component
MNAPTSRCREYTFWYVRWPERNDEGRKLERMLKSRHNVIDLRMDRRILAQMLYFFSRSVPAALLLAFVTSLWAADQNVGSLPYKGSVAEDSVPVLVRHLPEWESVRGKATFARSADELKAALGDRPILDLIDFSGGTEAATAPYDAGKLLIVEYGTPQDSIDADAKFTAKLSGDASVVYRRIGNYNAFVFDSPDRIAATALLDQVKYEKTVQWLGKNPFVISAERAFVLTTADIFLSTFIVVILGVVISLFFGIIAGYLFFYLREQKRASMPTFSDAGGMTRLNLDGLTPDMIPERLLNE